MDIFVSYAGENEAWAKWIVWELENAKARHKCIVQFRDFAPGMSFIQRMRRAAEAPCTLAVFSPPYFDSRYCQEELDAALAAARLLPVQAELCDSGNFLKHRIYIDLVGKDIDRAREGLVSGVEAFISQTLRGLPAGPRERPDFPGVATPASEPRSAVQAGSGPKRVLFLGPEVGGLSPRRQLKDIEAEVARSLQPKALRFKGVFDVDVNSLFAELNRDAPDVFHFSGKQSGGDILMYTEQGTLTTVSDMALAGMFESLDRGLQLVVMDTCSSARCARSSSPRTGC